MTTYRKPTTITSTIATTIAAVGAVMALLLSIATPASAQLRTAVTILHSIPGLSVDLVVDGDVIIAGFNAGDTQDLTPLAGQTLRNIEAREPGGGAVVFGPIDSFEVPSEGNASVVVHLDSDGGPIITSFLNESPPMDQGRGRLIVRHVAAAPPIEVSIGDEQVLDGIDNAQEGAVELPAGQIADAWITADGERIAQIPNLELGAQSNLTVYVGGSVADDTLAFYIQVVAAGEDEPVNIDMDETEAMPSDDDGDEPPATDVAEEPTTEPPVTDATVAGTDDGTPQPDVVNTGVAIPERRDALVLIVALGAALLAVGALVVRRRVT